VDVFNVPLDEYVIALEERLKQLPPSRNHG